MGLIRICLRGLPHSTRLMVGDKESPYDLSLRVLPHSTRLMVGEKESPYDWSALWWHPRMLLEASSGRALRFRLPVAGFVGDLR